MVHWRRGKELYTQSRRESPRCSPKTCNSGGKSKERKPLPPSRSGEWPIRERRSRRLNKRSISLRNPWVNLAENAVRTKIPANHDDFSKPGRGREVGLRSCLDFYCTIDDTGHIRTSLLRMVGIFLIKEAYFYVDWLRVIPRCSSGGMSESEQGPRSLVRFHRGELVAGMIIVGDASIRRLSSSPVFHHETLARA